MVKIGLVNDLLDKSSIENGGIEFEGDYTDLCKANLGLRSATRILVRIDEFFVSNFKDLHHRVSRISWEDLLDSSKPITCRTTTISSSLYHTSAVNERVLSAINQRIGEKLSTDIKSAPNVEGDDDERTGNTQSLVIRINADRCIISIDSSSHMLHKRGYRLETAKAPLRETLAAGIILASGWDRTSPLIDPFCGSGTIPIEAALMSTNHILPVTEDMSRYVFTKWKDFKPIHWKNAKIQLQKLPLPHPSPLIYGSDRDAGAIEASTQNSIRAGVSNMIKFENMALSSITPKGTKGWIVTNPPYGIRVSKNSDIRNLYSQLGNVLRQSFKGWSLAVLGTDMRLLQQTQVNFNRVIDLENGGLKIKLGVGDI
eukprot:TRINITY_DN4844_c0_g1_i4.p1 TRINITY_DN4844_c0_g1~~TRINITY_DN4844_c0_g1_i4.p1  ORF type:complete len:371 (-),score=40.91 TRINITY_DN4844_c0_g1_i4:118-1230(-)